MIAVVALSAVTAGAVVLSGGAAHRRLRTAPAMTVSKTLAPTLQALRRRMLKTPMAKPRTIEVPGPSITGYACPAEASSGPCGKPPCTVYAAPGNGRFALAVPLRSSPCAKALARTIPAMAR